MGRKRSGQQTNNCRREEVSDRSNVNAQFEQQTPLVEQLTQQLNDANQRLAQYDARSVNSQPTNTDSARILECLTMLLNAHEDLQPRRTLQRIEDKIDDLREREASMPDAVEEVSTDHEQHLSREEISADAVSADSKPTTQADSECVGDTDDLKTPFSDVLAPDPIDVDHADIQTLRDAVEGRDAYAVCLLHHMRIIERRKLISADDLAQIEGVPADRKTAVADLEARLQEVLRMTEVELSMERARVSRDSVRLQHDQNLLARQEAQLKEQLESVDLPLPPKAKSNRKWLDALGFGKD
jgi:hypothetical protein